MDERRTDPRRRIFKQAKIAFNHRQSVIDCLVRNLSATGACLEVASQAGVPPTFELQIEGETAHRRCSLAWQSDNKIGVEFRDQAGHPSQASEGESNRPPPRAQAVGAPPIGGEGGELVRGDLLALRAALDEVEFGVVLLDAALRAQFINRAFRKMWRLPDAKAEAKPAFAALMHHGSETGAYEIAPEIFPPMSPSASKL